jgi:hypothetical protein
MCTKWISSKTSFFFSAWIHCGICSHCAVPDHSCEGPKDGCFVCAELGHKRSTCPNVRLSASTNKLVELVFSLEKNFLVCFVQSNLQKQAAFRGFRSARLLLSLFCSLHVLRGGGTWRWVKELAFGSSQLYRPDMKSAKVWGGSEWVDIWYGSCKMVTLGWELRLYEIFKWSLEGQITQHCRKVEKAFQVKCSM